MNYNLIIIGGGPAGTGILFKALKDNCFDLLLDKGVAIIEKSLELMIGNLSQYQVNSDTLSSVFLECIEGDIIKKLNITDLKKEIDEIESYKENAIPLPCLKEYFTKLGKLLIEKINKHPKCNVFLNTTITKINMDNDGRYSIKLNDRVIQGEHVVITTGGTPSSKSKYNWTDKKHFSIEKFLPKMVHSDTLIKGEHDKVIMEKVTNDSTVVILGGGHSGFSSAHYLLDSFENKFVSNDAVKVYSNKPAKIFFNSKEEAIQHNYLDFNDEDFCSVTNRLYRLAGLRMDGRTLYMKMLGMIGDSMEKRVVLKLQNENENEFIKDMENADFIIQALGYTFNMISVYDKTEKGISFIGKETGQWVNHSCQLLNQDNQPVQNLYACGLATGFVPSGSFGGEPSFKGQTNGIWYYQNIIAGIILDQVI